MMEEEEAEESPPLSPSVIEGTEEVTPPLSVSPSTIRVTEAAQDGELLTFIIVSQKLSGTGEYHVDRTYEDFDWLQQHLFSLEDVPGIQGIIFPPLPARAQQNAPVKLVRQLGLLATGETWTPYCRALGAYLQQVAGHSLLSRTQHLETFLTSPEPPGRQKVKKGLFNRLSQAVEGIRKGRPHQGTEAWCLSTSYMLSPLWDDMQLVQRKQSHVVPITSLVSLNQLHVAPLWVGM
uniref:PX domain-containing protein n=1 Tax=Gadus morhua TaxID=8049 RepID=A0A8C4Z168_GADMO